MTVMHHHCAACGGRETYPEEIICQLSLIELASLSLVLTVPRTVHQKPHEQIKMRFNLDRKTLVYILEFFWD